MPVRRLDGRALRYVARTLATCSDRGIGTAVLAPPVLHITHTTR